MHGTLYMRFVIQWCKVLLNENDGGKDGEFDFVKRYLNWFSIRGRDGPILVHLSEEGCRNKICVSSDSEREALFRAKCTITCDWVTISQVTVMEMLKRITIEWVTLLESACLCVRSKVPLWLISKLHQIYANGQMSHSDIFKLCNNWRNLHSLS